LKKINLNKELLLDLNQESLKLSVYKEMTLKIFHSICSIKRIKSFPEITNTI